MINENGRQQGGGSAGPQVDQSGLTGLYAKSFCLSMINKFLEAHAEDPSQVFAVLMLDLDFFKKVNDTYGHQAGDEVLVQEEI